MKKSLSLRGCAVAAAAVLALGSMGMARAAASTTPGDFRLDIADAGTYPGSDWAGTLTGLGAAFSGLDVVTGVTAGGASTLTIGGAGLSALWAPFDEQSSGLLQVYGGKGFSYDIRAGEFGVGGFLSVASFYLDLSTHTLRAFNVQATTGELSPSGGLHGTMVDDLVVATFADSDWSGSRTVAYPAEGGTAYSLRVDNLVLTDQARQLIAGSLGLNEAGKAKFGGAPAYFGSVTIATVSAVPEPSTYALMGLGLLAAAGIARRRG